MWCDGGYDGEGMGRSRERGVFEKPCEVENGATRGNLTIWSGMIKTPDHRRPSAEQVFRVVGQRGQVFTGSRYPVRTHEGHPIE